MSKLLVEQDTIDQVKADFDSIKEAASIADKTPTSSYAKIIKGKLDQPAEIGGEDGDWVRPSNRPNIPDIGDDEQVMYWLFGVQKDSPNEFAIKLSTSTGQYAINWGDGNIDNYNSATIAEHMFDYDDIPGTPNFQGYKWVWIKATPVSGNFTVIDINVRHSLRVAHTAAAPFVIQVFEWYLRAPYVTTFTLSTYVYTYYWHLDVFDYRGTNLITQFVSFGYQWQNLKVLNVYTGNGINFSNFLNGLTTFNSPIDIDMSNAANVSGFLGVCRAYSHPIILDLAKVTVNMVLGTSMNGMKSLRLFNMGLVHTAVNITNSNMNREAIVILFSDLSDRTGTTPGTITITNSYGADKLTSEDRNIATSKNWTIVM